MEYPTTTFKLVERKERIRFPSHRQRIEGRTHNVKRSWNATVRGMSEYETCLVLDKSVLNYLNLAAACALHTLDTFKEGNQYTRNQVERAMKLLETARLELEVRTNEAPAKS